jgi:hypothetical protein
MIIWLSCGRWQPNKALYISNASNAEEPVTGIAEAG